MEQHQFQRQDTTEAEDAHDPCTTQALVLIDYLVEVLGVVSPMPQYPFYQISLSAPIRPLKLPIIQAQEVYFRNILAEIIQRPRLNHTAWAPCNNQPRLFNFFATFLPRTDEFRPSNPSPRIAQATFYITK